MTNCNVDSNVIYTIGISIFLSINVLNIVDIKEKLFKLSKGETNRVTERRGRHIEFH